jgi:hypothetical protein
MGWFSFSGWPQYAVVCTDTSIFWGVTPSIGMAALRNKTDTCDIVTSSRQLDLDHNISELKVSVYPQPADQTLFIDVGNSAGLTLNVKILNLLGELIEDHELTRTIGDGSLVINTSELNNGTYILQTSESGKIRSNTRILITH